MSRLPEHRIPLIPKVRNKGSTRHQAYPKVKYFILTRVESFVSSTFDFGSVGKAGRPIAAALRA